jgi:hypothetical protein
MSDSAFNVWIWDASQPERATRSRPNTRVPNLFPRVYRPQPNQHSSPACLPPSAASPSLSTSMSLSHSDPGPSTNSYTTIAALPANPQMSLVEELGRFSTSQISDALIALGLTHDTETTLVQREGYIPDIYMLSPSPSDMAGQNTRICGYAYTIK